MIKRGLSSLGYRSSRFAQTVMKWGQWQSSLIVKPRSLSFSQARQDRFVVEVLGGLRGGTFLDIGSNHPYRDSNSALLERVYRWRGIAVEIDDSMVKLFRSKRRAECIKSDALLVDYASVLTNKFGSTSVDYLSLDIDPPDITLAVLVFLLESGVRFRCLTFEHDAYRGDSNPKHEAHDLLDRAGYVRVLEDLHLPGWGAFEDWYLDAETLRKSPLTLPLGVTVEPNELREKGI